MFDNVITRKISNLISSFSKKISILYYILLKLQPCYDFLCVLEQTRIALTMSQGDLTARQEKHAWKPVWKKTLQGPRKDKQMTKEILVSRYEVKTHGTLAGKAERWFKKPYKWSHARWHPIKGSNLGQVHFKDVYSSLYLNIFLGKKLGMV